MTSSAHRCCHVYSLSGVIRQISTMICLKKTNKQAKGKKHEDDLYLQTRSEIYGSKSGCHRVLWSLKSERILSRNCAKISFTTLSHNTGTNPGKITIIFQFCVCVSKNLSFFVFLRLKPVCKKEKKNSLCKVLFFSKKCWT